MSAIIHAFHFTVKDLQVSTLGTFASELKHCVDVPLGRHKLKVLSLERILASKLAANRAKDKLSIPVLRDALSVVTAAATHLAKPKKSERRRIP